MSFGHVKLRMLFRLDDWLKSYADLNLKGGLQLVGFCLLVEFERDRSATNRATPSSLEGPLNSVDHQIPKTFYSRCQADILVIMQIKLTPLRLIGGTRTFLIVSKVFKEP